MLFEQRLPKDDSPVDDTNIVTTLLYYSEQEMAEFKSLVKRGMMEMYPDTFREANMSDFLLQILRERHGNTKA